MVKVEPQIQTQGLDLLNIMIVIRTDSVVPRLDS